MPNLYATNKTSSNITVTSCTVHFIDSADASLVTVYDGNDAPCDAFQYSLSGVPWWYVLDGVHDVWVDDLSSIGYHLPTPTLPTVTTQYIYPTNLGDGGSTQSLPPTFARVFYDALGNTIPYDSTVRYGLGLITGDGDYFVNSSSGKIAIQRVNGTAYTSVYSYLLGTCSDSTATVVTVYNSSNVAYNAFKFTASGTDYYYVLDGTQADWTDDLSSIGYSLNPVQNYIDVFFYINPDGNGHAFGSNDYWASVVIDSTDKITLQSFGVTVSTIDGSDVIGRNQQGVTFSFVPIGLYGGVRTGDLQADMNNFYCQDGGNNPDSIYYGLCIKNYTAYSTPVATWKCRITRL